MPSLRTAGICRRISRRHEPTGVHFVFDRAIRKGRPVFFGWDKIAIRGHRPERGREIHPACPARLDGSRTAYGGGTNPGRLHTQSPVPGGSIFFVLRRRRRDPSQLSTFDRCVGPSRIGKRPPLRLQYPHLDLLHRRVPLDTSPIPEIAPRDCTRAAQIVET